MKSKFSPSYSFPKESIIELLGSSNYVPMDLSQLMSYFGIEKINQKKFKRIIDELLEFGEVVELQHKGYVLSQSVELISGIIHFFRNGCAFLLDIKRNRKIYISAQDTFTALPGDQVLLREKKDGLAIKPDKYHGVIIRVINRNLTNIVGTLKKHRNLYYVEPLRSTFPRDIMVEITKEASVGDRVIIELLPWLDPKLNPQGSIIKIIGPTDNPAFDTKSVIEAYNLSLPFPKKVQSDANQLNKELLNVSSRLNLRNKFIITIDPETAKDFDDALSLDRLKGGNWKVGIHIADVSHFIPQGSALDMEAYKRGNSVYFTDQVIPMLPEKLANDICSLKPGVDRLAFSVFVTLDRSMNITKVQFFESIINCKMRLNYAQAMRLINSPNDSDISQWNIDRRTIKMLDDLNKLAQQLRHQRLSSGAIMLERSEIKINTDSKGYIESIKAVPNDEAHQLVEEFMLMANELVSHTLVRNGYPQIFRIHDEPDSEKLMELEELLKLAGFEVGSLAFRDNLNKFLHKISSDATSHAWYTATLRSLKRAEYSVKPVGHYGLAMQYYAHFTSPIRRYTDLVIHRILKSLLAKKTSPYSPSALNEIAVHCSQTELTASEAERDVIDLKIFRFFGEQLKTQKFISYHAIVVEVKNFGLFIYLPDLNVYGLVHVSIMIDDFYDFNASHRQLRGRKTKKIYQLGTSLNVQICRLDLQKRYLDFAPSPK